MSSARGRVLKAGACAAAGQPVRWEDAATGPTGPAARVEVIREEGAIVRIEVHCRCGVVHEVELLSPLETDSGRKEDET